MKKVNKVLSLFLGVVLVLATGACSPKYSVQEKSIQKSNEQENKEKENMTNQDEHYPVTITTYNWAKEPVELIFDKAPEKVVAIYQSSIETLLALGQGHRIVAASYLDDPVKDAYKEDFDKITYYEKNPTVEEVIGLEPDFILSWYSLFSEKTYGDVGFWHERDINTYILQNSGLKTPNTLQNEFDDIINLGKIFNAEDKANEIVDNMKTEIAKTLEQVKGQEKVRTVILEMQKDGLYRIYGVDSIGGDIATQVGADLIAMESRGIGAEDLVALNPDVIFTVYFGNSIDREEAVQKIMENPALASVSAVENNRVNPIVLSEVYASGVRTLDGIKTIIKGIYPNL